MTNKIRTGNLIIIIILILAATFYFSGMFDKVKDTIENIQTKKVEVELKKSDSLLSLYLIKNYDMSVELEKYDIIPIGISRVSKNDSGNIILLPDYKNISVNIPFDSIQRKNDSITYIQGYNDGLETNKPILFLDTDTTYWFISYHAKNKQDIRVYSYEITKNEGEIMILNVMKNIEEKYSDFLKKNTIIITFYNSTTKDNYLKFMNK